MVNGLRPLGFVERLFAEGNSQFGAWLMVRVVRVSGPCDVERLRLAADRATRQLPFLMSTISRQRNNPVLAEIRDFQLLFETVNRDSPERWQQEAELQLERRLNVGAAQWRMAVIHSDTCTDWELLLVYNHAIADPVAATIHIERILREYQQPTELVATIGERSLPLELLLHKESTIRNSLRFLLEEIRISQQQKTMAYFRRPQNLNAPVELRRTRVRFAQLPATQTRQLLQTAKQRSISLQGLLLASMIRSSGDFLHDCNLPCLTLSNLSLRKECGPGDYSREPGCFVYWFMNRIHPGPTENLLTLSQICTEHVRASIPRARPPAPTFGAFVRKRIEQQAIGGNFGRLATVGVSNIGPVALPEQIGELTVTEDYTITGQKAVGPEVMLLASTFGGKLHLTCCFVEPLLASDQMTQFRDRLLTELTSFD